MKKLFSGFAEYLKDWRNWPVHGIIGIAILLAAVFLPVSPWIRLAFLAGAAGFNIIRMRMEKKNKLAEAEVAIPIEETNSDKRDS